MFCLIATWRVPSERLTAVSVDLQCGSSAHLLPSLLSLQQVPREPRWTRASVSRSSSWQEPRPCLPVVNGGQRAPPHPQAPARRLSRRAEPASTRLPLASASLRAPCQPASATRRRRAASSGDGTRRSRTHARPAEAASSAPPRACRCGRCLASRRRASGLAPLQRSGRLWPQLPPRASRTLCRSSRPSALLPEVTPASPGPSHPGTLLLFALAASLLCSKHSAPRLSLA